MLVTNSNYIKPKYKAIIYIWKSARDYQLESSPAMRIETSPNKGCKGEIRGKRIHANS
jgi:hypothetical protein